jgi:cation transport ATPase
MTEQRPPKLTHISIKFLGVSVAMLLVAALITWAILSLSGQFTYWAILPILISFPVTLYLNTRIAKRAIAEITESHSLTRETLIRENNDETN